MKGLVADANIQGQVEYLVQRMQADTSADFWQALDLVLRHFDDIGWSATGRHAILRLLARTHACQKGLDRMEEGAKAAIDRSRNGSTGSAKVAHFLTAADTELRNLEAASLLTTLATAVKW